MLGAVVLIAGGCGGDDDEAAPAESTPAETSAEEPAAADEDRVIGYSNPLASEEGLRAVGYGFQQAVEALGLTWTVDELDAALSPDKQVADVDTFVSGGADGVVSWTLDPGAADAAYQRASEAGVPVVGVNSESDFFVSQVMANTDTTCIVAEEQAQFIADNAPGARVLAIGGPPVPSITLTTQCFLDAANELGLEIIDQQDDLTGTEAGGQEIMESLLLKYQDFDALWSFSDSTTLGAVAAIVADGRDIRTVEEDEGIIVLSRNGVQAAIDAIEAGQLTATWDNNQPLVGAAAAQLLKYHYVDGVPLEELPTQVNIPSKRWDLTNLDEYAGPLEREVPLPIPDSCPDDGCPSEIDSTVTG